MFEILLKVIWILLPAYTPNNFAVLLGGLKPMDFGKKFIDGRRIFGDGKTFSGFFGGILGGILVANVQRVLEILFNVRIFSSLPYNEFFYLVLAFTFGSMLGDSVGSFFKRRFGFERGKSFPIVDQLTFLLFAFAFASLTSAFWEFFGFLEIALALLVTPVLHLSVNFLAYKMKLKEVPW
ncbi:MAG: CDP-2,3-bis-(O-geranylgeranyl)-sn-glycerol synthase [Archaeoglobaceae archaeon]|nr:CDP-2,3-bis-(O-geranylgeranyl)-sn-glycerol synthase [Archaeoglobales archaeon]MDI9642135.1 CDP-2,3-bis-(O-geranylgeranyl)-sn-glycerol synthase [Archaeoglobales archaeon]